MKRSLTINTKVAVSKDAIAVHLIKLAWMKQKTIPCSVTKEDGKDFHENSFEYGYALALRECAEMLRLQPISCKECEDSYFADISAEEKRSSK